VAARPVRVRILLTPPRRDDLPASPLEVERIPESFGAPAGHGAVVIDVLRATSSLAFAFAAGAREALLFADPEGPPAAMTQVARPFLLCGERGGRRIRGFDLGNSPLEFTPERVRGVALLCATTNGAPAFLATHDALRQWALAFVNLEAGVRTVGAWLRERLAAEEASAAPRAPRGDGPDLLVVCAGKEGEPAAEDTACAARFTLRLMQLLAAAGLDVEVSADGAALAAAPESEEETYRVVAGAEHGRYLATLGPEFAADLAVCARWDAVDVVPQGRGARLSI
jgi:2-phosphosulfolactate phosphatase